MKLQAHEQPKGEGEKDNNDKANKMSQHACRANLDDDDADEFVDQKWPSGPPSGFLHHSSRIGLFIAPFIV